MRELKADSYQVQPRTQAIGVCFLKLRFKINLDNHCQKQ